MIMNYNQFNRKSRVMNHKSFNNMIVSGTSSFIVYVDYSSTSNNNSNNTIHVVNNLQIYDEQPNICTLHAVLEARDPGNLRSYNNIDEFFSDLEN